ncbi:MAG: uncharacterized protein A8A55_3564, partial [Amphiamblys sp. WSBS2006]
MKRVYENIKTIPKNSIQFIAKEIHAIGNDICVLLKLSDSVSGHVPALTLKSSTKEQIGEVLGTENYLAWVRRAKKLELSGYAVEILPRLGFHEENVMERLV